jgi:hypothetical protein
MWMDGNDLEFLRALHEEKIRTQNERTQLTTMKLAFVTVLFGVSSLNNMVIGMDLSAAFWLLYFVPVVAMSYDLYIMSADSRIKRVGIFLGRNPVALAGKAEMEWERFCASYRDSIAPFAHLFYSNIVTMGAAVFILSKGNWSERYMQLWFALWLVASLTAIIVMWIRHWHIIRNIGNYRPFDRRETGRPMNNYCDKETLNKSL